MERVISKQQKEIDRLPLMVEHNTKAWQRENVSAEKLALTAFSVLNYPENHECRLELRRESRPRNLNTA